MSKRAVKPGVEMSDAEMEALLGVKVESKMPDAAFSRLSHVDPKRLSTRRASETAITDAPDPSDEQPIRPPKDPSVKWLNAPSCHDQAHRFPETVRLCAPTTQILNLSDPDQLKIFNAAQASSTDHAGPFSVILAADRQFHAGSWTVFLTTAKLQYQKI